MSDDVQRAIKQLIDLAEHEDDWGVKMGEYPTYSHGLNTAITALTAYQQPTSEAVQRAIEWLEGEKLAYEIEAIDAEIIAERNESDPDEIREIYNRLARLAETAITALRQMKEPEPCDWCCGEDRFECYLIDDDGNTISIKDNVVQTVIAHFCPNCGRRLGVE